MRFPQISHLRKLFGGSQFWVEIRFVHIWVGASSFEKNMAAKKVVEPDHLKVFEIVVRTSDFNFVPKTRCGRGCCCKSAVAVGGVQPNKSLSRQDKLRVLGLDESL